jgi:hypothetical protein
MFAMGLKRIFSNPETIAVSVNINNEKNLGIVTQQIKGNRNIKNLFNQLDKQYFAFNQDYAIQGENGVEFNLAKFVSDFTPSSKPVFSHFAFKPLVCSSMTLCGLLPFINFCKSILCTFKFSC